MKIVGDFEFEDLWDTSAYETMCEACVIACVQEKIPADRVEVSLSFVSEDEIRELNREYRGMDKVTDVLSFPQFEPDEAVPEEGPIFLGDVVICSDVCKRQAEEYGHSENREFTYLFVHSILHLLGYDHMGEDERHQMRKREDGILERVLIGGRYVQAE